jgi:hypothetical protein
MHAANYYKSHPKAIAGATLTINFPQRSLGFFIAPGTELDFDGVLYPRHRS